MPVQWPLLIFTLLVGAGSGILAFLGISEFAGAGKKTRFIASLIAVALFILGGISSIFHLGHPANVMAAAGNLLSGSPISLELLCLIIAIIVAVVYLVAVKRELDISKAVGIIGILVSVVLAFVVGHGYEVIASRPNWSVGTLSLAYLFSGLCVGGYFFIAIASVLKEEVSLIKKLALFLSFVAGASMIAFAAYGISVDLGSHTTVFWGVVVFIGGIVPLVTAAGLVVKQTPVLMYIGFIAALAGGVAFRILMWVLGSSAIPGLFDSALNAHGALPF
jgi:anaerobic dimethyl sulfoxide reductase subunit C (anchor subunit)